MTVSSALMSGTKLILIKVELFIFDSYLLFLINMKKIAVIIGAGPAGLTAAYELIHRTDIKPIIFEKSGDIGGLAKTVDYKGNKIDIGGHRFFSKSDEVMEWWNKILPIQDLGKESITINYRNKNKQIKLTQDGLNPEFNDKVMLVRDRKSRILFGGKLFDYPITLNAGTFFNLGLTRIIKIVVSYIKVRIFPVSPEINLEDLFINRFGKELYLTFFKSYTEKVWGIPCSKIKSEWGVQRIKGLSFTKAIYTAIKSIITPEKTISQKNIETTLIQKFLYPKFGPGQMWREVTDRVKAGGGDVFLRHVPIKINWAGDKITEVQVKNEITGELRTIQSDYFFSTMPIKELANLMQPILPKEVLGVANSLIHRDFMVIGLLLKKLKLTDSKSINRAISDNWIYIQEPDVKVGRIQIFNNWSPYLVADKNTTWIGAEYFVNEGDELWMKPDEEIKNFVADELSKINFIDKSDVLDGVVLRLANAYPVYSGEYENLHIVRQFMDKFYNLFLVGRGGMHKYNSQDHSMLTAITAVNNIISGERSKDNIWAVDTEEKYRED
ncbi:MAG: UDP-galactopyranose mutase [Candidatus Giovannonibacteria bacterium GW2011_GWA1_43_15]|uniref:UDP-galactopyranose mutase n=2 Tax=Candidatus Giovannoniibacteriota TaxID=1752738 RepID=A0A0G1LVG9_9BACT|nr:MAG: UDP-galactopyranose mutase [Candidatus Giovannonibacteria bacterium GW2011_GWB1_43_13]KKS99623.1 MAG: UDP-galactopyranose mutase [Candidatus Giovannonibacteria bacterium GW2011_GWA1_43_15]KKT63709.1 MAG: UDP-galactopyranose mutase [Candidatus Giovannonibacteria bacterium GW2011_GWA2_44_26]